MGVGCTVIVNVLANPKHPFAVGVTVTVATTGLVPEFVRAVAEMAPVPEAAIAIEGVLFTQLNVVPDTPKALANVTSAEFAPLQTF